MSSGEIRTGREPSRRNSVTLNRGGGLPAASSASRSLRPRGERYWLAAGGWRLADEEPRAGESGGFAEERNASRAGKFDAGGWRLLREDRRKMVKGRRWDSAGAPMADDSPSRSGLSGSA